MAKAKETKRMRDERIAETNNGMTLRTRVKSSKKKYKRGNKKVDTEDQGEN